MSETASPQGLVAVLKLALTEADQIIRELEAEVSVERHNLAISEHQLAISEHQRRELEAEVKRLRAEE